MLIFKKKEYFTIFVIQVTEVLGFSLILPFLPLFAEDLGATPFVVGLILAAFSFFQFLSAPVMGRLSDHYGRKPLLLLSQFSTFVSFVILAFANQLWLIFASRIVDGLLGSNFTIAQAYLSDLSSKEERSAAFGISGMAFSFGFLIGPALGGFLSQWSYSIPSFLAATVALITMFTTVFFLPETIKKKNVGKIDIKIIDTKAFKRYFTDKQISPKLWQFTAFLSAHMVWVTGFALYAEKQLGFEASNIGYVLAYIGLITMIFRGVLLEKLIAMFNENKLQIIGPVSMIIGLMFAYFATEWWGLFVVMTFFAFGAGIMRPLLMGSISRTVSHKEQGSIMGVAGSLASLCQIGAPLISGFVINTFIPGTLGIAASFFAALTLLLVLKEIGRANP